MSPSQTILVLGASGYIGQRLVPRLARAGHRVIAAARHTDWLERQAWQGVQCQAVDLLSPVNLSALLTGCDTVYYLVHSMGDGADFIAREAKCALNLRDALKNSAIRHIIFLSALQPVDSAAKTGHLQARQLTARYLRESGIPLTELRAGIIVGAGSAAFEVMRDMVNNLPVLTPPRWVRSRTAPIALENLLVYLEQLLATPPERERLFEAAGPEVLSYQQQFERYMAISGRRRWLIPLPFPTHWISVWFLNMITSVPPSTARALIQGLKHDLLADDHALQALIPQSLITFDDAVRATLEEEKNLNQASNWGYDPQAHARWRPDYGYFPKQAGFRLHTQATTHQLWTVINQIGGHVRYFFGNPLWVARAWIDRLIGHPLPSGRPKRLWLQTGDKVDSWKVIVVEPEKTLSLLFGMKAPGLGRLTFSLVDRGQWRELDVRAWWHPHGIPGLLYWLAMMPAHLFIFRGMAKRIAALAAQSQKK